MSRKWDYIWQEEIMKNRTINILRQPVTAIVAAILAGLLAGVIILSASGYNAAAAYSAIFSGIFANPKNMAQVVVNAVPIILTGLSVSFAFKTGLFNIGSEGQFIIGALTAALAGFYLKLPAGIHPIVILVLAFLAGGLFGGLAGYLKNRFGIHEVISTIMLNWIAFYFNNFVVGLPGVKVEGTLHAPEILNSAKLTFFSTEWRRSAAGREFIRNNSILGDIIKTDVGWGILIAILIAVLLWYILRHTVVGFHLRSVGLNQFAAEFSGVPVERSVFRSMFIAGGVAALGGAILVMTSTGTVSILGAQEGYGWDGISVSLIANANPLANLFTGVLFSGLRFGGTLMQSKIGAPTEIINIMIGIIVLAISITPVLPRIADYLRKRQESKELQKAGESK